MLTYDLSQVPKGALYEHLYKYIRNDIKNGVLKAGEKLPSKRTLAKNLGVSTITVESAYAQLMSEGYVYSLPKRGYYISKIDTTAQLPTLKGPPILFCQRKKRAMRWIFPIRKRIRQIFLLPRGKNFCVKPLPTIVRR